ncbi:hypothetical protein J4Q44_G00324060 [Coregonus suidteri]|uniref:Protein c-Fos n=1 Tax=Coregonus suidteri TaxID=861788 RepID=A0AAN8KU18_9TELE
MYPDSSPDYDDSSSSSRSTSSSCSASPTGDVARCSQRSPDSPTNASSMDSSMSQDVCGEIDSPWHGRAKLSRAHGATQSSSRVEGSKEQSTCKKGKKQPLSEEDERRKIRRERNKVAAAKCRNRRRELTDTLQAETDQLEGDKEALQTEIGHLLKEKERLEQILSTHQPACKLATAEDDVEHEINDDIEGMLQDTADSAQLLSILENSDKLQLPEGSATEVTVSKGPLRHEMDSVPVPSISISASAILGNSNILLCSSAEEEPMEDLDFDQRDLQDLVPSLELAVAPETAPSVPDIDLLGGPFCLSDWETLYKSVANDLEPLCNPTMMSSSDTPTCSSYRSVFSFNYSEVDHMAEDEGCCESSEGLKGVVGGSSDLINGNLNSPTLLAL